MKRILTIAALSLGFLSAGAFAASDNPTSPPAAQAQQSKPAAKKSVKKSSKSIAKSTKTHRMGRHGQRTNR